MAKMDRSWRWRAKTWSFAFLMSWPARRLFSVRRFCLACAMSYQSGGCLVSNSNAAETLMPYLAHFSGSHDLSHHHPSNPQEYLNQLHQKIRENRRHLDSLVLHTGISQPSILTPYAAHSNSNCPLRAPGSPSSTSNPSRLQT
jgi:hypothetical protein